MLKKLNILLIAFLFISLLPLQAFAIKTDSSLEKPDDAEQIFLRRDKYSKFESIDYNISSTGATSGILYRTSKIKLTVGPYFGWIDSADFMQNTIKPEPNQTIYNKISLDIYDIAAALIRGGAIKDLNNLAQEVNYILNTSNDIRIGAQIEIFNASSGKVLARIEEETEVDAIAGPIGFNKTDREDMKTRWKNFSGTPAPWIDVIVTEPEEEPEDWDLENHLMIGKVVTPNGLDNISDIGKRLPAYYANGEKVNINFTFWNCSNTLIKAPLKYALVAMDYDSDWFKKPEPLKYLLENNTVADIQPDRSNSGTLSFQYTIDLKDYPFALTPGSQINGLSQMEELFIDPPVKNPVNNNDLFMTLAVVADPDAVFENAGNNDKTYENLATNIMVVHIPINEGPDFFPMPEGSSQWMPEYKDPNRGAQTYTYKEGQASITFPVTLYNQGDKAATDFKAVWFNSSQKDPDAWSHPVWENDTAISLAQNESQTFDITVPVPVPDYAEGKLVFKCNADGNTPGNESNQENNIMIITILPEGVDIEAILPDDPLVYVVNPGEAADVYVPFLIMRKDSGASLVDVDVNYSGPFGSENKKTKLAGYLAEENVSCYDIRFTLSSPGTYKVYGEAQPIGVPDINPANNKDEATVIVKLREQYDAGKINPDDQTRVNLRS